jgi:hypothetical protein
MPNEWKIKRGDVGGGQSGQLLDGCELRKKADGKGYELVAVLAETHDDNLPTNFPPFAYRGLIWDLDIINFTHGQMADQPFGNWSNNYSSGLPGEEDGTWTAQAGSGGLEEGEEDAASASA